MSDPVCYLCIYKPKKTRKCSTSGSETVGYGGAIGRLQGWTRNKNFFLQSLAKMLGCCISQRGSERVVFVRH